MIGAFYTENCIVTGEKATCWTGHVLLNTGLSKIKAISGFKDEQTMREFPVGVDGYNGEFKREYGLFFQERQYDYFTGKTKQLKHVMKFEE